MKFLQIGLGSMGKRRIRNLFSLGMKDIIGFDLKKERREECEKKYSLKTIDNLNDKTLSQSDALIISVPPAVHSQYILLAIKNNKHFFVEASVLDTDMIEIIRRVKGKSIVAAPSATMLFHPGIKKISEIVKNGELGKISNIIYHSGQYLPDWHKYEEVSNFYVSQRVTGGARELVPFELTWLTNIFGFPKTLCGYNKKTIEIKGAEEIDDTYNFLMDYGNFLTSITVDVVSRYATRNLLINGEKKQLLWSWDIDYIKLFNPLTNNWQEIPYEMKKAEEGYNQNIGENMYIEEMQNFIDTIHGKKKFINSMEKDYQVLKLLYAIEESMKLKKYVRFE